MVHIAKDGNQYLSKTASYEYNTMNFHPTFCGEIFFSILKHEFEDIVIKSTSFYFQTFQFDVLKKNNDKRCTLDWHIIWKLLNYWIAYLWFYQKYLTVNVQSHLTILSTQTQYVIMITLYRTCWVGNITCTVVLCLALLLKLIKQILALLKPKLIHLKPKCCQFYQKKHCFFFILKVKNKL